jgi:hypothetical protein
LKLLTIKDLALWPSLILSPNEFLQIFVVAAPVFVTILSKVYYILLRSVAQVDRNKFMHLRVSDV